MKDIIIITVFYLVIGISSISASIYNLLKHGNVFVSIIFFLGFIFCIFGLYGHLKRNQSIIRDYKVIYGAEGNFIMYVICKILHI